MASKPFNSLVIEGFPLLISSCWTQIAARRSAPSLLSLSIIYIVESSDLPRLGSSGTSSFWDLVPFESYDQQLESAQHNGSTDMRTEISKIGHVARF